ncbi:bifunctional riboflavin kinase/FAD synthetase [Prolixibacter sp. SD074]|uniref:bifunctional riboflavin kinase/FAD synthetase n=1 Tax=Prolixibacter sp. SD074 TaxID=2652391 RepID=UPI001271D191|nr:bifunctional riboflavin kinase/FAD synthetase [Prolixibacter sp. SD074]GET30762.1 riboflavin biosynthesis protein [Prolixibacter sp. SD074]
MEIHNGLEHFNAGKPVITIGTFDGVHLGHRQVISRLKEIAGSVNGESVVFTFYPHPRLIVSPEENNLRLLTTRDEKIELLKEIGIDHLVVFPFTNEFSKLSYEDFVRQVLVEKMNISHLVVGYDHKLGRNREGNYTALKELSKELHFTIEQLDVLLMEDVNVSSTKIRQSLETGDVARANRYLGYNYTLTGKVIAGNQLGRKLGFPTANIETLDEHKLIPHDGVYAVRVKLDDACYTGMLNIGTRPTISHNADHRSIEVHIFDFNQDVYLHELTLYFVGKIRNEHKFDSVDALREQLEKDKESAKKILSRM